jgi:signal transduction histidine kinase/ligand-binding sensor domain-containing protein/DNA-binding response OmpR family regulator
METSTRAQGLAGDDVRALVRDVAGRVWVGTDGGLSRIDDGRIATWRARDGLLDDAVTALAPGRNGGIWAATARGVCTLADGAKPRCLALPAGSAAASAVLEPAAGPLLVATQGSGVFEVGPGGELAPACSGCLGRADARVLLESRRGGLWVGLGWGGGVALIRDGTVTHYREQDGLPQQPVSSLYEDAEGSLWIATDNGGLARLRPKRVATYTTADGLPAKVVTSIVQDAKGSIWAASLCGPVSELRGGRFVPRFAEQLGSACPFSVLPTRDGSLWLGTHAAGLFRWDGRRMHHYGPKEGLSDSLVCGLFEDRDGVVWIGTNSGGVHRFSDGKLSRAYGRDDGVATGYLCSFAQDREGRVWLGSNANGLSVYERGAFRVLGAGEGPPARNIAGLLVDSRGDLWIGTAADGLFRRKGGAYQRFGPEQGLGDALVALTLEDRDGTLWVSTTRGISRLLRARLEAVAAGAARSLDPIILDRADGLPTLEGSGGGFDPSGLRARDGRLWFSTIDGVVVIDPASFPVNRLPPRVAVESVLLAGRRPATSPDEVVAVPAGTHSIEIAYTAFSLLVPPKVRFRYRLAGLETNWEDVGARRTAYFSRLPPGDYAFEVLAANNDGTWSDRPATLKLTVAPHPWERGTLRVFALGVLLLATGGSVRWLSLRRAEARLKELQLVQERRARDAAEAESRNKAAFLASMSHEVRTPMNAVLGFCHLLLRTELSQQQRHYLARIRVGASSLLRVVDDILDLSKIEAGRLELEQAEFALEDVLQEIVTLLGLKAHEKGLALLVGVAADVPRRVLGDRLRLAQVLLNLVGNALKFTERGHVLIRVRRGAPDDVLEFAVEDSGPGLRPDQVAKLFQPFTQAESSTTRRHGGTGLGLHISAGIVERMRGRIWADSEEGRGSVFRFTASLPAAAAVAAERPVLRSRRALLVDPDPLVRDVLGDTLRQLGLQTREAASVPEALQALAREPKCDLLLVDVQLPGRQSLGAGSKLVLLESPYARERALASAEPGGVAACVDKAIGRDALLELLAAVLEGRPPAEPAAAAASDRERPSLSGLSVLVVEDNPVNQEVALELLRHFGARAASANDGREALELIGSAGVTFDVVLMDVQMPEMDGCEATRRIRALPGGSDLRIVAITANALPAERQRCLESGMNDYLTKPLDPARLFFALGAAAPASGRTTPAADAERSLPGVDFARGLVMLGGERPLLEKLIRDVALRYAGAPVEVRRLVDAGRLDEAARVLHRVRGAAAQVCADTLLKAASGLEAGLGAGRADPALLREFEAAIEELGRTAALLEEAPAALAPALDAALLGRFSAALADKDMSADDLYLANRAALEQWLGPERSSSLARAMRDLDYGRALEIVKGASSN